jgi:hypothetical protein
MKGRGMFALSDQLNTNDPGLSAFTLLLPTLVCLTTA